MFKFKHYLLTIALLSAVPAYTSANENDELDAQEMLAHEKAETAFEKYDQDQAAEHEANLDGRELRIKAEKEQQKMLDDKSRQAQQARDQRTREIIAELRAEKEAKDQKIKNSQLKVSKQDNFKKDEAKYMEKLEKEKQYKDSLAFGDVDYQLEKSKLSKEAIQKLADLHVRKENIEEQIIKIAKMNYKKGNMGGRELLREAQKEAKEQKIRESGLGVSQQGNFKKDEAKYMEKLQKEEQQYQASLAFGDVDYQLEKNKFSSEAIKKLADLHVKKEIIEEQIIKIAKMKYNKGNMDGKELLHEAEKMFKDEEEKKLKYAKENRDGKELRAEAEKAYKIEEEKAFLSEVDDLMEVQADEVTQVAEEDCVNCKEDKTDRRISALEGSIKGLTKKINSFFSKDKKEKKEQGSESYLAGIEKFMAPMLEKIMTPISQGLAAMIETQKQMAASITALATKMENGSQMNNSILQGIMIGSMISGNYNPQGATFNPFNPFSAHYSSEEMLMNKYIGGNNFYRANRPAVGFNFGTVNQSGIIPQS